MDNPEKLAINGTQDTGRGQHKKTADNLNGDQNGPHQKPG
jgi:hypothetical protein